MSQATSSLIIEISAEHARRNAELLRNALQQTTQAGNDASQSTQNLDRSLRNTEKSLSAAELAALKLTKIFGGYLTISEAITKSDMYTNLQNRLKLVTKSQTELNQAMNDTFKIAQATGSKWESAAQVYQRFADNAKNLGIDLKHTAQLTETVSKAIAISGGSATSAEAALTQFGQSLASGVFRGEEFNSVAEQAPGLLRAIANGLDVNIGELRKMANTGKLTGDVLVKALDKSKDSVDKLFGKTDFTIAQSFTMLSNEVVRFVGETNKGTGAATTLSKSIQLLSSNFNLVANTSIATITGIVTALLVKQGAALGGVVAQWYAETAAMVASNGVKATSITLSRTLATALLGPVGLGLAAAGAAASFLIMRDNADEANKKLEEQTAVAYQTKTQLLALQGVQKKGAVSDLKTAFEEQNKAVKKANDLFNAHIIELQNSYRFSADLVDISNQVRNGTMSQADAIKKLNDLKFITPDQLKQVQQDNENYNEKTSIAKKCAEALDFFGIKTELAGNKAQNATVSVKDNTEALDDNTRAAKEAAQAQKDFFDKLNNQTYEAKLKLSLISIGYDSNVADKVLELQNARQKVAPSGTTAIFNTSDLENILHAQKVSDSLESKEKQIADQKERQTKELEKQIERQKALQLASNKQLELSYRVYEAFKKAGLSKDQALAVTAQVGRENDFQSKFIFGKHQDHNNHYTNVGMLSWQGSRATDVVKTLKSQDLLNVDGTIKQTQKAIDTMASSAVQEIFTKKEYLPTRKALMSGEGDYEKLSGVFGKNFVRWDMDGNKLTQKQVLDAKKKQKGYYDQLAKFVGDDDKEINLSAPAKDTDKLNDLRLQYDQKYYSERKKSDAEYNKVVQDMTLIYSGEELTKKLALAKKYHDADARLELLKLNKSLVGWKQFGEEKIRADAEIRKAEIDASTTDQEDIKALRKKAIDEQTEYEIKKFHEANQAKLAEYAANLNQIEQSARGRLQKMIEKRQSDRFDQSRSDLKVEYSNGSAEIDKKQIDFNKKVSSDKGLSETDKQKEIMDAERAFNEDRYALEAEFAQKRKDLEESIYNQKLTLAQQGITGFESAFGTMSDVAKNAYGENSKQFKAMFTLQKSFAIAAAGVNIAKAISDGWGQGVTIYDKIAQVGIIAANTASIISNIQAVNMQGFKTGGYTGDGGVNDVAGVVHGKEFVLTAEATRRVGVNTLNAINNGADIRATQQAQQTATAIAPQINSIAGDTNLSNYNFFDADEMLKHAMASPKGTRVLINWMGENSTAVRGATQG